MLFYRFNLVFVVGFTLFSLSFSSEKVYRTVEDNNFNSYNDVFNYVDEFDSLNQEVNECYCGNNSQKCEIKDGLKYCTCKKGYVPGINEICTEMCNDTRPCANGGTCHDGLCSCPPRTTGTFCEKIDLICWRREYYEEFSRVRGLTCCCSDNETVSELCQYDVKNYSPYCKCEKQYEIFEDNSQTCKECNCGKVNTWTKCDFYNGVKTCFCKKNFEYNPTTKICEPCNCGNNSMKCEFTRTGAIKCNCRQGFVQYRNECLPCDCGLNGVCELRDGKSFCLCNKGYQDYKGSCTACICGNFGVCNFSSEDRKAVCDCDNGYSEKNGICEYCYCGDNSKCNFDENGQKNCSCPYGYRDINGFCRDINECEGEDTCPAKEKCVNIPGGYVCACADGYKHTSDGCTDINECEITDICGSNECVNFPGSYECKCKSGSLSQGGRKNTLICQSDSASKVGYGVLTTIFVLIIIGLLTVLYKTYRR